MSATPEPIPGGAPTLEEKAREIIWRVAVWQDDADDSQANCSWEDALEYEDEMGELVPRTIDAAREVHALYADALATLRARVRDVERERDHWTIKHARATAALEEAARALWANAQAWELEGFEGNERGASEQYVRARRALDREEVRDGRACDNPSCGQPATEHVRCEGVDWYLCRPCCDTIFPTPLEGPTDDA